VNTAPDANKVGYCLSSKHLGRLERPTMYTYSSKNCFITLTPVTGATLQMVRSTDFKSTHPSPTLTTWSRGSRLQPGRRRPSSTVTADASASLSGIFLRVATAAQFLRRTPTGLFPAPLTALKAHSTCGQCYKTFYGRKLRLFIIS
jgi:hypothetical protein